MNDGFDIDMPPNDMQVMDSHAPEKKGRKQKDANEENAAPQRKRARKSAKLDTCTQLPKDECRMWVSDPDWIKVNLVLASLFFSGSAAAKRQLGQTKISKPARYVLISKCRVPSASIHSMIRIDVFIIDMRVSAIGC